jgi:2-polyprenyl-6-hydroxyphenyl methylase/3-demethylubiquinone-9 3-methyltransferase
MTVPIGKNRLLADETVDGVLGWFSQFPTDTGYLRGHFDRFKSTLEFALAGVPEEKTLTILDIGAHWLHNAFFYANRGHRLICMDAPDLASIVKPVADAIGAEVRPNRRMEKADGFVGIPDDSVDMVLFCEIIEHLAFNPIPFWKQVYRVLRSGGRIIVTTPNAFYHRSAAERLERLLRGEGYGPTVDDILSTGTYGHHWKEFTVSELRAYFAYLSPDFDTTRFEMCYPPADEIPIIGGFEDTISQNVDVRAAMIYLDVVLRAKEHGITVNPPWDVL